MATRLEPADMPCGSCTFQRRSLWSTCKTMLASPGGWSNGAFTRRKSGPNCSTGIEPPSTRSRIFTWAECPPSFDGADGRDSGAERKCLFLRLRTEVKELRSTGTNTRFHAVSRRTPTPLLLPLLRACSFRLVNDASAWRASVGAWLGRSATSSGPCSLPSESLRLPSPTSQPKRT